MINRRALLRALVGSVLATPFASRAQQARKIARLGFLRIDRPPQAYIEAFEQGLRERGYEPGKSVLIEYRFADGRPERFPRLAAELVRLNVDVILVGGGQATQAAKNATSTIPIVMLVSADPVGSGFAATLAHPGGNITGSSIVSVDVVGKRMELLRQVLPRVSRVAVLINRGNPGNVALLKESGAAGAALGLTLQPIEVQGPTDFNEAFAAMVKGHAEALIVLDDALFDTERQRLVQLAAANRLPAIYGPRSSADAGGLMSFGGNITEGYRQAGVLVDQILKGAKPGDVPIVQSAKFDLVINLKTAKALGLTIPQSLLLRADEVIQ